MKKFFLLFLSATIYIFIGTIFSLDSAIVIAIVYSTYLIFLNLLTNVVWRKHYKKIST